MISVNSYREDWFNFLLKVAPFSEMEESAVRQVSEKLKPISLSQGAYVYRQGDLADALYILESGKIKISSSDHLGKEKILNYLSPGEILGETTLLTGLRRTVDAKVEQNCRLLALYRSDFEDFLQTTPSAALYLSRLLGRKLVEASLPWKKGETKAELLGLLCDLPEQDYILFVTNLCLALTEQTRKHVLLLELTPHGEHLIDQMRLKHSAHTKFSAQDWNKPDILDQITSSHPSGFKVISLSEDIFAQADAEVVNSFMESLKEIYDYVLLTITVEPKQKQLISYARTEITRWFFKECSSLFYIYNHRSTTTDLPARFSVFHDSIKKVFLGTPYSNMPLQADFILPWNDNLISQSLNQANPYIQNEKTFAAIERLARYIGKLQVGIAMGSGAAYGYTLIGIMKVFEREKIPIDMIAGTSMGAVLGSFFASGLSAQDVEKIAHGIDKFWIRHTLLNDLNLPWPRGGFFKGNTISQFLQEVLGQRLFSDLKIPFRCIGTNILTGGQAVLKEGKVWQAVRASLSIPIIFKPYDLNGDFLVDGGLVNPVPTSTIASMGADIMISVNLTGKVSEKKIISRLMHLFPKTSPSMLNVLFNMIYTMQYQIACSKTDLSDIVIQPNLEQFTWVDFHKAKQIIPRGEEIAEQYLSKIKNCLPFFANHCQTNLPQRYFSRKNF